MTYHRNLPDADLFVPAVASQTDCFECGKHISGAGIEYHGHDAEGHIAAIYLHPTCATVLAQRLICDGYPNRRQG